MRHRPGTHTGACHCGSPATVHVAYGSGCGNVCRPHAETIKAVKGGMYSEGALILTAAGSDCGAVAQITRKN
jgi:hypothetical protein